MGEGGSGKNGAVAEGDGGVEGGKGLAVAAFFPSPSNPPSSHEGFSLCP